MRVIGRTHTTAENDGTANFDNIESKRVNSKFSLLEVEQMESSYAEENVSTEQQKARQKARLSRSHGDKERPRSAQAPTRERTQEINGSTLLRFGLPKEARLRKRAEFLRVYEQGRRIEGRFMTVFLLPGNGRMHRVGVTATKKAIGKAHDRNRAKRLLRECFRTSRPELEKWGVKYDWVLNARRNMAYVKLEKPLAEFRQIIGRIAAEEL
jgi:ribonuclease P protein component